MFSSGANYNKLKTNLRLAINRLKLLEKKKTELAQKARKEIADYIATGKYERAKIRVEHIIREDYLVEALEVVEMYCDLILARFGLVQQMKSLDEGLAEAISSLLWAAPRLQTDVGEIKMIAEQLTAKYGKPYAQACREGAVETISEKLIHKLSIHAPPKILVEKYLIEIAKNYNIEYEPDPQIMKSDESLAVDALLVDIDGNKNNLGGGSGGGMLAPEPMGFVGFPQPPVLPSQSQDFKPFNYPSVTNSDNVAPPPLPVQGPSAPYTGFGTPFTYNIPPSSESSFPTYDRSPGAELLNTNLQDDSTLPPPYSGIFPPDVRVNASGDTNKQSDEKPKPAPRSKLSPHDDVLDLPELPNVPSYSFPAEGKTSSNNNNEEIDFDDLTRRFEDLKKKK